MQNGVVCIEIIIRKDLGICFIFLKPRCFHSSYSSSLLHFYISHRVETSSLRTHSRQIFHNISCCILTSNLPDLSSYSHFPTQIPPLPPLFFPLFPRSLFPTTFLCFIKGTDVFFHYTLSTSCMLMLTIKTLR